MDFPKYLLVDHDEKQVAAVQGLPLGHGPGYSETVQGWWCLLQDPGPDHGAAVLGWCGLHSGDGGPRSSARTHGGGDGARCLALLACLGIACLSLLAACCGPKKRHVPVGLGSPYTLPCCWQPRYQLCLPWRASFPHRLQQAEHQSPGLPLMGICSSPVAQPWLRREAVSMEDWLQGEPWTSTERILGVSGLEPKPRSTEHQTAYL